MSTLADSPYEVAVVAGRSAASDDPKTLAPPGKHAIGLVLSRLLGAHGASISRPLAAALRRYAHARAILDDGSVFEPPAPWVDPLRGACTVATVLSRHGLSTTTFKDWCSEYMVENGGAVPLPYDLLQELVADDLWPVLGLLIADGPRVAAARMDRVLLSEAHRPLQRVDRRHAPRPQDKPRRTGQHQLKQLQWAMRAVNSTLVDLSARSSLLGASLNEWDRAPVISAPAGDDDQTDTTAPRRPAVRLLWQRTQADIARRLPMAAELGEVAALERLNRLSLVRSGLFHPLRLRALLVLLAVVGARVGAIGRLRVGDLEDDRLRPDGSRGPAIVLRPAKRMRDDVLRYKPIPRGAAEVIRSYLIFLAGVQGRPLDPHEPLFVLRRRT
jgi:integrase